MKFTKQTFFRALRTFCQSALSYMLVNIAAYDYTVRGEEAKSIAIGLAVSSLAAGFAAVMNLEEGEHFDI
ncbi:MAG: hypothetical protein IJS03_05415 [Eubacterium sp.]|nr:hypothetical protein [Eubacterium sp.]